MPLNDNIADLIIKHLQETITAEETKSLEQWMAASEENRTKFNRIVNGDTLREDMLLFIESDQRIRERVYAKLPEVQDALTVTPKRSWMRWASVAAAVLVIAFASIWLLRSKETTTTNGAEQQVPMAATIPAGGNKATLTLADGTVIDLDKAGNGTIATEGKTKVTKTENGQLEYKSSTGTRQSAITYNLLSTPRGGQYQLILPDGSKVWLNAASSIKYPTEFSGNERRVEVTGETYFEIVRNTEKPFRVTVMPPSGGPGRGGEIEVVGTHFNINAYGDEPSIKTTLLEGKVKVSYDGKFALLRPGQQSQLKSGTSTLEIIDNADLEQAVAWKNGFFQFDNADLRSVMRQLSRWYDLDVEYQGKLPNETFGGRIDRSSNASEVLNVLEQNQIHFKIQGKKIIVTPNEVK